MRRKPKATDRLAHLERCVKTLEKAVEMLARSQILGGDALETFYRTLKDVDDRVDDLETGKRVDALTGPLSIQ